MAKGVVFEVICPYGYDILHDVSPLDFDVSKLSPRAFLGDGEGFIPGDELRKRAMEFGNNWGFTDGRRIFAEQDSLSLDLRPFRLVLPGTVLFSRGNGIRITSFNWNGKSWEMSFCWYYGFYGGVDRLLAL